MRRIPKHIHLLTALLAVVCIIAPIHVFAHDAAHLHERLIHGADAPVVKAKESTAHAHHHHHDGADHHKNATSSSDGDTQDGGASVTLVHKHDHHHHHHHRHYLSDHEIIMSRVLLAKTFLVAIPNHDRAIHVDQDASLPYTNVEHLAHLHLAESPPLRGPPSFLDITAPV